MKVNITNRQKGFTLIEMMMAAVIGGLIVAATTYAGVNLARNYRLSDTRLDIQSQARLSIDWLVKDIRSSTDIVTSYSGYTTGANELVLKVLALDDVNENDTPDDYVYDYIVYHLNGTNLQRTVDADNTSERVDGTKTIAMNVSSLSFSCDGVVLSSISDKSSIDKIAINIAFSKALSGNTVSKNYNALVYLRNHDLESS